jgi:hypothetical protein
VLEVLRTAGGSLARTVLREAVDSRLAAAELDRATEALVARGLVHVERTTTPWKSIRGRVNHAPVMRYTLTEHEERAASVDGRQFWSSWGPKDGPILWSAQPPALGLYESPGGGMPAGVAYPVGWIQGSKAPVATFRLIVGQEEVEGVFLCDRRRFVPLGEAAE